MKEQPVRSNATSASTAGMTDLLALSYEPIVVWRLDGGIERWNAGAERLYGFRPEEALGRVSHTLLQTKFPIEVGELTAQLQNGHYWSGELHHTCKDGREVVVDSRMQLLDDDTVLEVNRDVTEIKALGARQAILMRECSSAAAKFEALFNQSGIFAGIMDLQGYLREANSLSLESCGYTREQVLDRHFWETPWWRGSEEIKAKIRFATDQAAAGFVFREELPYWLGDGRERIVDFAMHPIRDPSGSVMFLHPIGIDITERKQAETALRESEQRLRWIGAVVESSDDAIISKNLNGIISSWNKGAERLFNYTAEEVIGQPITIIIPQDRLDEEREILARIRRGERIDHFETVRQRKHGGLISISLTVSPVKNAEGKIVGASKVARDISEQKLAWDKAERADRAKSSFLAAASHDLRQPLQTLKLLQAALEPHHPSGEARKLVARIGQSLDTMTSILSSLLDVNRLESGDLRPSVSEFSVNEIFESLAGDFAPPVLERGLRLHVVRSGLIIRSDRHMLAEMIRNLLSNAIRYTDRGRILLGCRRAGDNIRIEVWDSGVGITEDELPHIFHEYYQGTDGAVRGGFGLGLAIVKRLGDILDHRIEVHSIPGKGTRFFIEVPRGRSGVKVPDAATPVHPHKDVFLGNVLAIEDEASVRLALRRLLKEKGVDATIVATTPEALTLVREQGLRPDVLLCDYNLRGWPKRSAV
jgi:PAS domain S-box-containing protein